MCASKSASRPSPNMSNTAELRKYEYRPLREGPNNIRLIQILPGTGDAGIVCQVFQYTLRNEKAFGLYEALSYVWGDFNSLHDILVRNSEDSEYRSFRITHNLYLALRRLRDPDLPRTFWIDAICINQNDLQERAMQVTIMARIYAYATSVSVWLGEADNDSSATFDLLQGILGQRSKRSLGWTDSIDSMVTPAAASVDALLERAWFRRAWVVQEAVVARVTSVTCGDAGMPGAMFAQGMDLAVRSLRHTTRKPWDLPAVLMLMDSRTQRSLPLLQRVSTLQMSTEIPSFEIAPLGDLLNMFENHEATDERDKIYALLGLSSDNALAPDLRPDYTKSWSLLFEQVTSHILGSTATISVVEGKSQAVISDFGCALGTVAKCNLGTITVASPCFGGASSPSYFWEAKWVVPHERGRCKKGDILIYLQEARRPCVVRPCRDHFDIVLVSLPEPKRIEIIESSRAGPEASLDEVDDTWTYLMRGARKRSRKFTLVWDWSTKGQDDYVSHVARIETNLDCHPTAIERCFNTARVLDDMSDHDSLLQLLQVWSRSTGSTPEEEHLILLEQACTLWNDFCELKRHIQDLYLSVWALNAPINYSHIYDYWIDRGFLGPDLFDITHLAKVAPETAVASTVQYEPYVPLLEPIRNPLLPMLFPRYLPVTIKEPGPLSTGRAVSLHSGRFLMKLVLAKETALVQPSDGILDKLRKDRIMAPRFFLAHTMLSEHESTHLNAVEAVEQLFGNRESVLNAEDLEYLLRTFSFDPSLTYDLLGYLAFYTHEWMPRGHRNLEIKILEPLVDIFVRHLKAMSDLEFGSSADARRPFNSVLSFLYTSYALFPSAPCSYVSKNAHAFPFSMAEKSEWAQKAILQAVVALRRVLQPHRPSYSDGEQLL